MSEFNIEYIEIGPKINESIAVFDGDTHYKVSNLMSFEKGDNLTLSSINTTVHLGAHADSPLHYGKKAPSIDERNLNFYIGKTQVINITNLRDRERIKVKDLDNISIDATRVLFKTSSFTNPYNWHTEFNSLSAELIEFLKLKGVKLVGIDTPSVDPADDKKLETHNAILKADMAILEGLVLEKVDSGIYYLMAMPLRLENLDASPVRPILFTEENWKKLVTS